MRFFREHDETKAAISPVEVHHEANLVNGPDALENGIDLVLEQIARYLADEYLAALCRWFALVCRCRTESSLTVFLDLLVFNLELVSKLVV